jgi:hypothetical protein
MLRIDNLSLDGGSKVYVLERRLRLAEFYSSTSSIDFRRWSALACCELRAYLTSVTRRDSACQRARFNNLVDIYILILSPI